MAALTAPVRGSGSCPAWMARVAKPCFAEGGFAEAGSLVVVFLAVIFSAVKEMSPSEMDSLEERIFPKTEEILLPLSYLNPYPPHPRSNELKDLEAVGRQVFEE